MNRVALAIIAVSMLGGCSPAIRGDGSLAVVEISPGLRDLTVNGSHTDASGKLIVESFNMEDAYCAGAHLWDAAGAQVRCRREIGNRIATSDVHVDVADAWEEPLDPGAVAWYLPGTSLIRQTAPDCGAFSVCVAQAAHELGHALGLQHLDAGALMAPNTDSASLTDADLRSFSSIWHN